ERRAVPVRPEAPPARSHRFPNDFQPAFAPSLPHDFAPLGREPLLGGETTHQLPLGSSRRIRPRWSATSCSPLLQVRRTRQRGVTDPESISAKASPPLVTSPSSGARPTNTDYL